jgi:hypothetical protein
MICLQRQRLPGKKRSVRTRAMIQPRLQLKKAIRELLERRKDAIAAGDIVVLYVDECHLLWDDARGYVWSKANQRVEIPMMNYREKQTYYGAIEHVSGEVTVKPFPTGNGASTVALSRIYSRNMRRNNLFSSGMVQHIIRTAR